MNPKEKHECVIKSLKLEKCHRCASAAGLLKIDQFSLKGLCCPTQLHSGRNYVSELLTFFQFYLGTTFMTTLFIGDYL